MIEDKNRKSGQIHMGFVFEWVKNQLVQKRKHAIDKIPSSQRKLAGLMTTDRPVAFVYRFIIGPPFPVVTSRVVESTSKSVVKSRAIVKL